MAPYLVKLMRDCADICVTALRAMASGSINYSHICAECATICSYAAEACEDMDGMEEFAAASRACAESCRTMALAE